MSWMCVLLFGDLVGSVVVSSGCLWLMFWWFWCVICLVRCWSRVLLILGIVMCCMVGVFVFLIYSLLGWLIRILVMFLCVRNGWNGVR